jgi:magnesium transporter
MGAADAAALLAQESPAAASGALRQLLPNVAQDILAQLPPVSLRAILAATPPHITRGWNLESRYPEDSVGSLMEPPVGVFGPHDTVAATVEKLREITREKFITYCFVTGDGQDLIGVITMRDLLLNPPDRRLEDLMLRDAFRLRPETSLLDAMKSTLHRHYPVYPVCEENGRLVGLVRGQALAEAQAFELTAQAGSMVGVEKEERLSTPLLGSLKMRHPWLQLNLVTAFVAAFVVGIFEDTIAQVVALAVFLPVLAGQSGNTGCQALAVTLRGMTLGELKTRKGISVVAKESVLGLANGFLVGITAGLGMLAFALWQGNENYAMLAIIVFVAMTASCLLSGAAGAAVPMVLQRLGADPATASSIFLTTATDVVSMGLFLGLATWLIL